MSGTKSDPLSLEDALAGARAADRLNRIEWRDRVAVHGPAAIDAVFEWAGDRELGLGAFAVRVIEAAGKRGGLADAVQALTAIRSIGATEAVRSDAADALMRLQPNKSARAALRGAVPVPDDAGWDWPGFSVREFGDVTGTTWRRRVDQCALIPLLLRPLQELDADFSSYPIYQLPEVHIAVRERYEQGAEHNQGWRASKLVVYAHSERDGVGPHAAAGIYVEKGTGADEFGKVTRHLWDWPRFVDLVADPVRRAPLIRAFERHPLRIGDYTGGRFGPGGCQVGFVGSTEDGDLVLRDGSGVESGRGWDDLTAALRSLPEGVWHDLHLWREWPADEAIRAGQPFAVEQLLPVLRDLAAVYLSTIQ